MLNWKGELAQWLTFVGAPTVGALAAWLALRGRLLQDCSEKRFVQLAVALFVLTRVVQHVVVFHVFGYAGGHDLLDVWAPIGRTLLEGGDYAPLVDNLYGPLFPHVLALGLLPSGGAYAPGIDWPFVVADGLALVVLWRVARRRFADGPCRALVLGVLLCPLLWHGVVVRTQDEPLFTLFLLLTLDAVDRRRMWHAALAVGIGTLLTKALLPLWAFPILLAIDTNQRRAWRTIGVAAAVTLSLIAVAAALGWDPTGGVRATLGVRGSSAWFLFGARVGSSSAAYFATLGMVALGCVAAGWAAVRSATRDDVALRAARGVVAVQAVFFVLSPFTLPPHLVHALPFLAWLLVADGISKARAAWRTRALAALFCAWQVPSVFLNSELWRRHLWLIAGFVLWCAWTGVHAFRRFDDADRAPDAVV